MYTIELTTRLNPGTIVVEHKEPGEAETLYKQICQSMETGIPRMIHLTCESKESKKVCVLTSEILAVQIYKGVGRSEQLPEAQISERRRAGFRV